MTARTVVTRPIGFALGQRESAAAGASRDDAYFILEALRQPGSAIDYFVSQRLGELYPDRALLESADSDFDVEDFARARHCRLRRRNIPWPQLDTTWCCPRHGARTTAEQVWFGVEWNGEQLELLQLTWDSTTYRYVLAARWEVAREFFNAVCRWNSRPPNVVAVYNGARWLNDGELYQSIRSACLDTLVLRPGLKEELLDDVQGFFSSRTTYERYGVPWKRGILLIGPPGNGKTHAVKGVLNALDQPCLYVKSFRSPREPGEFSIQRVFRRARSAAPCVLVLEDLDSLVTPRNRSYFLNELDGFAGNDGILTLATTNHPERLDPAILERPSRFDRKYAFDLPARPERVSYLCQWNERLQPELRLSPDGIERAAEMTQGFSFAYLKELCLAAVMRWMAAAEPGSMDTIAGEQATLLRGQMVSVTPATAEPEEAEPYDDEDEEDDHE